MSRDRTRDRLEAESTVGQAKTLALDCDDVLYQWLQGFHPWLVREGVVTEEALEGGYRAGLCETHDLVQVDAERAHELEAAYINGAGRGAAPLEGAVRCLEALSEIAALHVVTARARDLHEEATEEWLGRHFPEKIASVHYTYAQAGGAKQTKRSICERIGAAMLVDDYYEDLLHLRDSKVAPLLYGALPWSSRESALPRAENWDAAVEHVRRTLRA